MERKSMKTPTRINKYHLLNFLMKEKHQFCLQKNVCAVKQYHLDYQSVAPCENKGADSGKAVSKQLLCIYFFCGLKTV